MMFWFLWLSDFGCVLTVWFGWLLWMGLLDLCCFGLFGFIGLVCAVQCLVLLRLWLGGALLFALLGLFGLCFDWFGCCVTLVGVGVVCFDGFDLGLICLSCYLAGLILVGLCLLVVLFGGFVRLWVITFDCVGFTVGGLIWLVWFSCVGCCWI